MLHNERPILLMVPLTDRLTRHLTDIQDRDTQTDMDRHKYRHDGDALKGRQTRPIPTDAFVFRPSLLKYLMANPLTNKSIQTPSIKLMPHLHQHPNIASLP